MFEDEPEEEKTECPTPELMLEKVLKKRKSKPKMFPPDLFQAARYWMAHQEQPRKWMDDAVPNTKSGKVTSWHTPYHDRLCFNLKIFFQLKHIHQVYVIENVEAGVPWRGDPPDLYIKFVGEAQKMRSNKEKYIDKTKQAHLEFKPGSEHGFKPESEHDE